MPFLAFRISSNSIVYMSLYAFDASKHCCVIFQFHLIDNMFSGQVFGQVNPLQDEDDVADEFLLISSNDSFWLSGPLENGDVVHRLRFKLAHDLCLVHSIRIRMQEGETIMVQHKLCISLHYHSILHS